MLYLAFLALLLLGVPATWAATSTTLQSAVAVDGVGTAATVSDVGHVGIEVVITGKANVNFEGSVDGGATYRAIACRKSASTAGDVNTTNASGIFLCHAPGLSHIRTPVVGWQTGTVTVTANVQEVGVGLTGSATAAAPTFTEGLRGYFSWDLTGNLRTTIPLIYGEDSDNDLLKTSGGPVRPFTIMTGVTSNTTSATTTVDSGGKTPMASVTGTGAVTATVTFYGDMENTTSNGEPICAIVLSGTTKDVKSCRQFTKDWPYYHAVTTAVTGTSATVEAIIAVGAVGVRSSEFLASGVKTADALIKTGYGFLQCITIAQHDAAPTAGTISINDATSAGTGTVIFEWVLTTAVFTPFQVCPQVPFTTGLYFDFTTTSDVNVSASYQ